MKQYSQSLAGTVACKAPGPRLAFSRLQKERDSETERERPTGVRKVFLASLEMLLGPGEGLADFLTVDLLFETPLLFIHTTFCPLPPSPQ